MAFSYQKSHQKRNQKHATYCRLTLLVLLLLPGALARAEMQVFGDFEVHYTAFRSTLVPASVADAHGIVRSNTRIITNVTVRYDGQPVRARISGTVSNLLNQMFQLDFVEVTEETAVYYLASQVIDEKDTLRYQLEVQPDGAEAPFEISFMRQYFGGQTQ